MIPDRIAVITSSWSMQAIRSAIIEPPIDLIIDQGSMIDHHFDWWSDKWKALKKWKKEKNGWRKRAARSGWSFIVDDLSNIRTLLSIIDVDLCPSLNNTIRWSDHFLMMSPSLTVWLSQRSMTIILIMITIGWSIESIGSTDFQSLSSWSDWNGLC